MVENSVHKFRKLVAARGGQTQTVHFALHQRMRLKSGLSEGKVKIL